MKQLKQRKINSLKVTSPVLAIWFCQFLWFPALGLIPCHLPASKKGLSVHVCSCILGVAKPQNGTVTFTCLHWPELSHTAIHNHQYNLHLVGCPCVLLKSTIKGTAFGGHQKRQSMESSLQKRIIIRMFQNNDNYFL